MTDKQIIIDSVDVSGCSYGEIEKDIFKCSCEYNVRSTSMFCKDNPNCYYKQLKHKEQELQEAMDNYVKLDIQRVKEYNELVDKYNNKEQECEELKKDLHQNFKEKDKLHLIIDRLLEASVMIQILQVLKILKMCMKICVMNSNNSTNSNKLLPR